MKKALVWILIFAWIFQTMPLPVRGEETQPKPKSYVAVMDFEVAGYLTSDIGRTVSDKIRETLLNTGEYFLVDRSIIEIIIKEQKFSQTGLCDQSCAIQVGRIASAQFIVTGRVAKMSPEECRITAQLTDTETTNIVKTASESYPCSPPEMLSAAETVALVLAGITVEQGTMVISAKPKSTVIFVDGNRKGKVPVSIKTKAGSHKVIATATGYMMQEKKITLAPDESKPVSFNLKKKWYNTWWFYTVGGAVLAGGITAAVIAASSGGGGGGGGGDGTNPTPSPTTGTLSITATGP